MIGFTSELYENKTEVPVYELEEGKDMLCLCDGLIVPARDKSVNSNTIVVGSTRSGKTTSIILPTIFHSYQHSLVIPIVKRKIFEQCAPMLKLRGYEVIDINLADPQKSSVGYDREI